MPTLRDSRRQDECLIRRWREFRIAAAHVAEALSQLSQVRRVVLFGSAARPLTREVPRFREYRRAGIELYHECKDADLAVWLARFDDLRALQRARVDGLDRVKRECGITFAHHQIELFLFDAATGEHCGRLCNFRRCPIRKPECRVRDCGLQPLLRQVEGFAWREDALAEGQCIVIYDPQADPPLGVDLNQFDADGGRT